MSPSPPQPFASNRSLHGILAAYSIVFIVTALTADDRLTWVLENILVVLGVGVLAWTHRRFAFSNVSYLLIALYLCLHAVGANTGYMHAPAGEWLRDAFGLSRNPYDRVIH